MKQSDLFFQEGSSDKVYHIQLEKADGGFVVNFQYGRRGNALQSGTKTPTPVSEEEANKIFDKLEKEKTRKGYQHMDVEKKSPNGFSGQVAVQKKEVIILPQLLNAIEDVEEFINDDSYLAQEKMDGERRMLISKDKVIGLNKKGQEVQLPNSIIDSISDNHILDGEIIGDKLFVFDILSVNDKDLKDSSCYLRVSLLNTLKFGKGIEIVPTAHTKAEKMELFERLKKENKEGIVFKKKTSPYTAGRPASGGNALKFKFHKTATFIVEGSTKGKRSVGLNILDGDKKVFMGKVTIPPNHEIPNEGELVEVRYLYAYKGGAIFQPVYLGKRPDSDLTDATIKQIVYKAENEIA